MVNSNSPLKSKRILVTGGTGSLGQTVVRRLLTGELGMPSKIVVFSRDEAKQYYMRHSILSSGGKSKDVTEVLDFRTGDIRDYEALEKAVHTMDVIIHAAALKQVPNCERYPFEAVQTNIIGAKNLIRAVARSTNLIETVVGISTDKACKPVNVMGMSKAIMERILIQANLEVPQTRFINVRYGNVVASRGSVIPLFVEQIKKGGPLTITSKKMTRFLLSLDEAVCTVFNAIKYARSGETFIPIAESANIMDIAEAIIANRQISIKVTGIRPGEKIHEILVSEEELARTVRRGNYYVICPMLPELSNEEIIPAISKEYTSADTTLDRERIRAIIKPYVDSEASEQEHDILAEISGERLVPSIPQESLPENTPLVGV